jgi:hypothetical protein
MGFQHPQEVKNLAGRQRSSGSLVVLNGELASVTAGYLYRAHGQVSRTAVGNGKTSRG